MVKTEIETVPQETVSIVVRTVAGRSILLDRALFTIFCNDYKAKEVIVVFQGIDPEALEDVCSVSKNYPGLSVRVIQNPVEFDDRANNLNIGMQHSHGRYLAILDDDDLYYPQHLSTLIDALQKTESSWAYSRTCLDVEVDGKVCRKEVFGGGEEEHFSFMRLLKSNFIPSHTFLVDRSRLPSETYLFTHPDLCRNEDYYIILKLAFLGEPVFCNTVTTSYSIRDDSTQTNIGITEKLGESALHSKNENWHNAELDKWQHSEKIINALKHKFINKNYWLKEFLNFSANRP